MKQSLSWSSESEDATLMVVCGCMLRRSFRNELERLKFMGYSITWHEGKTLLQSTFTVKGPDVVLQAIWRASEEWNKADLP